MKFGEMLEYNKDDIFLESDGRMYKKEPFVKSVPRYTFISGKFIGKFYSTIEKTQNDRGEYFNFKIYEAEVEIKSKGRVAEKIEEEESSVKVSHNQMPDKVYFFERIGNEKKYFNLEFQNQTFYNFKFISKLQQNEGLEAFGTIEAEFKGCLVDFLEENRYKKRYRLINLIKAENPVQLPPSPPSLPSLPPPPSPPPLPPTPPNRFENSCRRDLILASLLAVVSLFFGITPLFIIGILWLLYVLYRCYSNWLKYLGYLLGLLFLIGLIYSVFNVNWNHKTVAYIPKPKNEVLERPQLVKVIMLISKGKKDDFLIERSLEWEGYNGEYYTGKFSLKKSDLDLSTKFKNQLSPKLGYNGILYNISSFDSRGLDGVFRMFDSIKEERKLNSKKFAEMIVSFVQYMPYYVVIDETCNPTDYKDENIRNLLLQNPGRCAPNQKFGITTPLEFLATSQGDCDSRTVLLYTILKHYGYNVAILSSEVYAHSILGISLPYNGTTYSTSSGRYILWETTDKGHKPGVLPVEITNLNYWSISLK